MTMLQFSGIFINLSVRHNTRLPLWCATQTVTAYSTISNPQVEQVDQKSKISSDEVNFRYNINIFISNHFFPFSPLSKRIKFSFLLFLNNFINIFLRLCLFIFSAYISIIYN